CGARRLAAIKRLGWKTVRVWVRADISDRLGQLLAEQDDNMLHKPLNQIEAAALYRELKVLLADDAKRRQEASRFSDEHQPGGVGAVDPAGPYRRGGEVRHQAARMVTGRASYSRLEQIGFIEKVAADPDRPDALRGHAREELALIEAGGPVEPAYTRIRNEAGTELERLAQQALARVRAGQREVRKKSRLNSHGPRPITRLNVRAFTLTWDEFDGWTDRYDLPQLAAALTDEQITKFHTVVAQLRAFGERLDAAREHLPVEQRGQPADRRAHLRAL
ncbi:MAG TPA: chromosome partitioning protein ParB, partial [Gryllotalpicola sp.]